MPNSAALDALIVQYKALGAPLQAAHTDLKNGRAALVAADQQFNALTGSSTNNEIGDALKAQQTAKAEIQTAANSIASIVQQRNDLEAQARALIDSGGG